MRQGLLTIIAIHLFCVLLLLLPGCKETPKVVKKQDKYEFFTNDMSEPCYGKPVRVLIESNTLAKYKPEQRNRLAISIANELCEPVRSCPMSVRIGSDERASVECELSDSF